jgi:hypothetical protein
MSKTARCKTCHHSERARVELAIANGVSLLKVARQYGGELTKQNLSRHWIKHVTPARKEKLRVVGPADVELDLDALKRAEGESLLQNLIAERARLQRIADLSESVGHYTDATRASVAVVKVLELIAKYLGELRTGNTTIHQNFLLTADWVSLRRVIAEALRPYPEAQRAVLAAVRAHESSAGVEITHAHAVERPPLDHVQEPENA